MKHIKKLLAVSMLALCSVNYSIVNASEHDHSFEGHRCSCGAYSFEAEDGLIGGTCSDSEQLMVNVLIQTKDLFLKEHLQILDQLVKENVLVIGQLMEIVLLGNLL